MKLNRCIAILMLLAVTLAPAVRAETPFWLKTWTVARIDGADADRTIFVQAIGKQIVLAADRLVDPLGEDCEHGLSYDDVRSRPVAKLGAHFGAFWKFPEFPSPAATYGWIRCDGTNIGAFAFVDGGQAYLFYEGGAV